MKKLCILLCLTTTIAFGQNATLLPNSTVLTTNGTNTVLNVSSTNAANSNNIVNVSSNGNGAGINVINSGLGITIQGINSNSGSAAYFQTTNSSNTSPTAYIQSNGNNYALRVLGTGPGEVARFENSPGSIERAVTIYGAGSGTSLTAFNVSTGTAASFSSASNYALQTSGKLQFAGSGVGTIATGKVLKATNNLGDTQWADDGLSLPYSNFSSVASGGVFSIDNSNNSINGSAIRGANTGGGAGISGVSTGTSGYGVWGQASNGVGVYGNSNGATGYGVLGYHETNTAVRGESDSGTGGFFTSTSGYALITGSGNVGIRTTAPTASLDVHRGTGLSGTAAFKGTQWYSHFNYSTTEHTYIRGGKDAANVYINDLATLGNVSVGNGNPIEKLHVFGNLRVTGTICNTSGAITTCSDIRYKKDFSPIENPLHKVTQLKGLHYYWKTDEYKENNFSTERQVGFVAQEIEKIFPEMVFTDAQGYKSVDYARLTPVLVEAIKELKILNEELTNKNEKLEGRLSKIEVLLERFDSEKVK